MIVVEVPVPPPTATYNASPVETAIFEVNIPTSYFTTISKFLCISGLTTYSTNWPTDSNGVSETDSGALIVTNYSAGASHVSCCTQSHLDSGISLIDDKNLVENQKHLRP